MKALKEKLESFAIKSIKGFSSLGLETQQECSKYKMCSRYKYRCTILFKDGIKLNFPITNLTDFKRKAKEYSILVKNVL